MPYANEQVSLNPQAQVVVFQWSQLVAQSGLSYGELAQSTPLDVSHELLDLTYSKDLGGDGSFTFSLPATQAWGDRIQAGMWVACWLSQNRDLALPATASGTGTPVSRLGDLARQGDRLRFIGVISRVAFKLETAENGAPEAYWEITGSDFTVVYSGCNVWLNYMYAEAALINTIATLLPVRTQAGAPTVDQLLRVIHQLFYEPQSFGAILNQNPQNPNTASFSTIGYQWLLPAELLRALGLQLKSGRSESFWGNLEGVLQFSATLASRPCADPTGTLSGNALQRLREYSVPELHELFTEVSEAGVPQLIFRPIPWKTNATGYPHFARYISSMLDLWQSGGQYVLKAAQVFGFDLGIDSHARANHFLATVETANFHAADNISELAQHKSPAGRTFPYAQPASIARYGFFPAHFQFDTFIQLAADADGQVDTGILSEANEVLLDYFNNAIFLGTGSVDQAGNPQTKVGRVALLDPTLPVVGNRLAYIEGYTDHFEVHENGATEWTQNLRLTRMGDLNAYQNALGLSGDATLDESKITFANAKAAPGQPASYTHGGSNG